MDVIREISPEPEPEGQNGARSLAKRTGARIRVREDYELPEFRGAVGTVEQEYIHSEQYVHDIYRVLGVRFTDGRYELFWNHEVEAAE